MPNPIKVTLLLALLVVQGCATFDGARVRERDADAFLSGIEARTEAALSEDTPLDLDHCIKGRRS